MKIVDNLAQMRGLVIFALNYATAVEMKSVMYAMVALVIFTSATFKIVLYCEKCLIQGRLLVYIYLYTNIKDYFFLFHLSSRMPYHYSYTISKPELLRLKK